MNYFPPQPATLAINNKNVMTANYSLELKLNGTLDAPIDKIKLSQGLETR